MSSSSALSIATCDSDDPGPDPTCGKAPSTVPQTMTELAALGERPKLSKQVRVKAQSIHHCRKLSVGLFVIITLAAPYYEALKHMQSELASHELRAWQKQQNGQRSLGRLPFGKQSPAAKHGTQHKRSRRQKAELLQSAPPRAGCRLRTRRLRLARPHQALRHCARHLSHQLCCGAPRPRLPVHGPVPARRALASTDARNAPAACQPSAEAPPSDVGSVEIMGLDVTRPHRALHHCMGCIKHRVCCGASCPCLLQQVLLDRSPREVHLKRSISTGPSQRVHHNNKATGPSH